MIPINVFICSEYASELFIKILLTFEYEALSEFAMMMLRRIVGN